MAWRIDQSVERGELDFTIRGEISGSIAVAGRVEPILLRLSGIPFRDLAGHRLRFTRATGPDEPVALEPQFSSNQSGAAGDMTASKKVKVPGRPLEELFNGPGDPEDFPWHWENCLSLEWFSEENGRVVLESTSLELEIEALGTWSLDEAGETAAREQNRDHLLHFMEKITTPAEPDDFADYLPREDEGPVSSAEAMADEEAARQNKLLDRIGKRLEEEGSFDDETFDRIMAEERERLRIESGEPERAPLTPEEEARRERWIDEMNAAANFVEEDQPASLDEDWDHPLAARAMALGSRLNKEARLAGWLDDSAGGEHPLEALADQIWLGATKLAGALNGPPDDREWPPDPLFAGDKLVRLKAARDFFHDALAAVRSAQEDALAKPDWLRAAADEVSALLAEVEQLIADVRRVLE
jgi:hypothetical protein